MRSGSKSGSGVPGVESFRAVLLTLRREHLCELGITDEQLRELDESHGVELEERSQDNAAAELLALLGEHGFMRLRQIDGALSRLERGAYGLCTHCNQRIPVRRLRADPIATLCGTCARTRERPRRQAAGAETDESANDADTRRDGFVPAELRSLDDAELAALVRESFHDEVGAGLQEVRVLCRHGLVTLAGEVASDELRQVARRIVEDEIGLELVDRMLVDELRAESDSHADRNRRARLPTDVETSEAGLIGSLSSENILDVEEEGLNFTPPTRPVPESE